MVCVLCSRECQQILVCPLNPPHKDSDADFKKVLLSLTWFKVRLLKVKV